MCLSIRPFIRPLGRWSVGPIPSLRWLIGASYAECLALFLLFLQDATIDQAQSHLIEPILFDFIMNLSFLFEEISIIVSLDGVVINSNDKIFKKHAFLKTKKILSFCCQFEKRGGGAEFLGGGEFFGRIRYMCLYTI